MKAGRWIGAAVVVAVLLGGCRGSDASEESLPKPPRGLEGEWRVVAKVIDAAEAGQPIGTTIRERWTVKDSCASGHCPLVIHSRDEMGATPATLFEWAHQYTARVSTALECTFEGQDEIGEVIGRSDDVYHLKVTRRTHGTVTELRGTVETNLHVFHSSDCDPEDEFGLAAVTVERVDARSRRSAENAV